MPRVPVQEDQLRAAALPSIGVAAPAAPAAFGGEGEVFAAARGALGDVSQYAAAERQRADELAVQQADLETAKEKLRLLKDPKTGAFRRKGQETLSLPDEVGTAFDKFTRQIQQDLTSSQRAAYGRLTLGHKRDLNDQLQGHIFSEMVKFDADATKARLDTAAEEAALNFADPTKVRAALDLQKDLLRRQADRADAAGVAVAPETLERQIRETTSKTHLGVISRMLTAGDASRAEGYFAGAQAEMEVADAARVEAALKHSSILGEAQRRTEDLMRAHPANERAALEAARDIADPEVQKAVAGEVKTRFAEERRLEQQDREQAVREAANIVEQAKSAGVVPPVLWTRLSVAERAALETRSRQLREGVEPVTNWPVYYEKKTLASSDATRDKFLQENLMVLRPELADAQFKELIDLQASLRKGEDAATQREMDGYRTKAQIVNDALNAIGVDPTPKPGRQAAEDVAAFRNLVEQQVRELQQSTGKRANNADVQQIVDGLVIKVATPRARLPLFNLPVPFTGGERRAFEVLATKKSDVPAAEILKIEDALKRARLPATDEAVMDTWNRNIQRRARAGQ